MVAAAPVAEDLPAPAMAAGDVGESDDKAVRARVAGDLVDDGPDDLMAAADASKDADVPGGFALPCQRFVSEPAKLRP